MEIERITNFKESDLKKDDLIEVVDPLEPERNGTYKVVDVTEFILTVIKIAN